MSNFSTTSAGGKAIIVALFGLPGSGKTTLMKQLENDNSCTSHFMVFEGSEIIDGIVPGGVSAFKGLGEDDETSWREEAIRSISRQCVESKKMGIITGHYMFWNEGEQEPPSVLTPGDWSLCTHIAYLDLPVERIQAQIFEDTVRRNRASASIEHLSAWQKAEIQGLKRHCLENDIAFQSLSGKAEDILDTTLEYLNRILAEVKLDSFIESCPSTLRTVLLLDGDKTLIPEDTGEMFWEYCGGTNPLKAIFDQGYSYRTFREATVQYHKCHEIVFREVCEIIAGKAHVYTEFMDLLEEVGKHEHVAIIVVTCGQGKIWENILRANGVSEKVHVMGCEKGGIIITPDLKGVLVDRLHMIHEKFVWAFGDSPVDLPMLCKADQAIVVVGEKGMRSRSMEGKLADDIKRGLYARQVLMQSDDKAPLLDISRLPVVQLQSAEFVNSITKTPQRLQYLHATAKDSAKLLMSATRNADCSGPALVDAHRLVGRDLATEYLGSDLGLETYKMKHVQVGVTEGYRLIEEANTVIVPLMRGGEPMARGVWEAFPSAMYVHAKKPSDLDKVDHIVGRAAVVLVDGVVNTGKSVVDFVEHIRGCGSDVKIVVVAGVVQEQAVEEGGVLERLSNRYGRLSLIALRISENKYTGKGSTDTGHRLFNTTHME